MAVGGFHRAGAQAPDALLRFKDHVDPINCHLEQYIYVCKRRNFDVAAGKKKKRRT